MLTLGEWGKHNSDFFFQLKEIKTWQSVYELNWKKVFTHFYNKFRAVNCMHYLKYYNILQFWLLQKIHGTLDHNFIATHTILMLNYYVKIQ